MQFWVLTTWPMWQLSLTVLVNPLLLGHALVEHALLAHPAHLLFAGLREALGRRLAAGLLLPYAMRMQLGLYVVPTIDNRYYFHVC